MIFLFSVTWPQCRYRICGVLPLHLMNLIMNVRGPLQHVFWTQHYNSNNKNHTSTIIARHLIFAWRYYTILGWVFQARSWYLTDIFEKPFTQYKLIILSKKVDKSIKIISSFTLAKVLKKLPHLAFFKRYKNHDCCIFSTHVLLLSSTSSCNMKKKIMLKINTDSTNIMCFEYF